MQVEYIKFPLNDRLSPITPNNRRGQGHLTRFLKFCPDSVFGVGKSRHFKCRMLIDTVVYWCMNYRLPPKGMCSGSRDRFKFWKISDNISETVQGRDMVALEV